jgi:hypothetical protein
MPEYKKEALQDKIRNNILLNEAGCWIWSGSLQTGGYGQTRLLGKTILAHRLSYMAFHGEIKNKRFVCHSCDCPPCVNPDHLWLGTPRQNFKDAIKKNRHVGRFPEWASRLPRKRKLSHDDVLAIRASTEPLKELAQRYNCSLPNISMIRNGRRKKLD